MNDIYSKILEEIQCDKCYRFWLGKYVGKNYCNECSQVDKMLPHQCGQGCNGTYNGYGDLCECHFPVDEMSIAHNAMEDDYLEELNQKNEKGN